MVAKARLAQDWPVFQPRYWGFGKPTRGLALPWYGLDTERDAKSGVFVCGYAVGERVIEFERLTELEKGTYWVYNLAYDMEGMLRDLRIEEAWAARADGAEFTLDGAKCRYFHGKRFDYKGAKGHVAFIEASSFFNKVPLSKIGAKKGGVDASKMSVAKFQTDAAYEAKVREYCIQDARVVYEAINRLDGGVKALGVPLGSTPGATARGFLARLPKMPQTIWGAHKPFLRCYCGGRFEITKRGVLWGVKQYDLVSAYPWALTQCPWLTESAYPRQVRRYHEDALYGTYEIRFRHADYLGVAPRWRDGVRVYSSQEERTWVARPELEYLQRIGADYDVLRGVEIWDENARDLWRRVVEELFAVKQGRAGRPEGMGAKVVLNSMYGILIQLIQRQGKWVAISAAKNPVDFAGTLALEEAPKEFEAGKYYAPVYAGNLTALTRVRVLEAAADTGADAYVGGHTDSVLTTGKLRKGLGKGLGDWKLEKAVERADVCKTGMYAMGDVVKIRGITRKGTAAMLWEPTFQRSSRIGIKRAANWDEVSVIVPKTVANNFAVEMKRNWAGEMTRGMIALEKSIDSAPLANVGA